MQETLSKTLTFKTFVLTPVNNEEVVKTDTSFFASGD